MIGSKEKFGPDNLSLHVGFVTQRADSVLFLKIYVISQHKMLYMHRLFI